MTLISIIPNDDDDEIMKNLDPEPDDDRVLQIKTPCFSHEDFHYQLKPGELYHPISKMK